MTKLKTANTLAAALCLAFTAWAGVFLVNSSDFWWHVKAGEILLKEGWITTEPFAYTREGAPYLAIFSWLSQIIIYLSYAIAGFAGVIILRILLMAALGTSLLMIDPKRIWPNAFAVGGLMIIMRPTMLDRPQLFSYAMLGVSLFLIFKILDLSDCRDETSTKNLYKYSFFLILSQILWTNLHGGAAVLNLILTTSLFAGIAIEKMASKTKLKEIAKSKYLNIVLALILALTLSLIATPIGFETISYVYKLYTDNTSQFIKEWRAPDGFDYITSLWFPWLLALSALLWTRKNVYVFSLILASFGLLSLSANRHIPVFAITAIGTAFYQLKHNGKWRNAVDRVLSGKFKTILLTAAASLAVLAFNEPARAMFARENFSRIGAFEPYKSSFDFIEKSAPKGNMFNSYSLGGYLLYRGYPNRKIFVDGRNVDHGYEFLDRMFKASKDPKIWQEIEKKYDLTYAIIDYMPKTNSDAAYPYGHLNSNPGWALVYLDDWTAVYFKRISEHIGIIETNEYKFLTPENFARGTVFNEIKQNSARDLTDELLRQSSSDKSSVRSLLLLAEIFYASGIDENALMVLEEAQRRQPDKWKVEDGKWKIR